MPKFSSETPGYLGSLKMFLAYCSRPWLDKDVGLDAATRLVRIRSQFNAICICLRDTYLNVAFAIMRTFLAHWSPPRTLEPYLLKLSGEGGS